MRTRMLALKSAVPSHILEQSDVTTRASHLFKGRRDIERLLPVFTNTGIDRRYSCVPIDWYADPHGWQDRTELYVENATNLFEQVTRALLAEANLTTDDIDAIVVASTTGIATPSLDALVVERMQLRRDIRRLPIFGLGCAGGVIGLARASAMAQAMPGSRVLFLVVELCALTFRKDDLTKSNIVATALFGDGAAGVILSTEGDGPELGASGEHTWPQSLDIMGWEVEEDGLKARFAQSIPVAGRQRFQHDPDGVPAEERSQAPRDRQVRLSSRRCKGARRAGRCVPDRARRARREPFRIARLREHVGRDGAVRARAHGLAQA